MKTIKPEPKPLFQVNVHHSFPPPPAPRPLNSRIRLVGALALGLIALSHCRSGAPIEKEIDSCREYPNQQEISQVRDYIRKSWGVLTRSHKDLLAAAPDPKIERAQDQPWTIYLSATQQRAQVEAELKQSLSPNELQQIELRVLPDDLQIETHGLLYLPHPYVVPGGRFNEMYGWDSYFIQVGLLRDGELELARNMVENFLYQIEHYGTILNANRTYFLTRSQPPFLTRMVLGVFDKTQDRDWLRGSLSAIDRYYRFWTAEPHLIPEIGLSRYFDLGDGPAPEVVSDERDEQGRTHYDRIREYFKTHQVTDYDVADFYDREKDQLTEKFYKGDRSMRESGFDPSNRFGPFSADIVSYAPVCLNSLLYLMETDTAEIYSLLGEAEQADLWKTRAAQRAERVEAYLWDAHTGLYLDYDFSRKRRRHYEFATTFYPLWVGLASADKAQRVVENLAKFEAPGGILTSTSRTGSQWDAPFGWAPLQMIAVQGLKRYGFDEEAERIARKFITLVAKEFGEHNVIVEKYDVTRCESDVSEGIEFGYSSNEIGFGWTNAVFVELLADLD